MQILSASNAHWVAISTIRCQNSHVCIYDSIIHKDAPTHTKDQIATILCSCKKITTLEFVPVQVQKGASGLCAIAFATTLANGLDPSRLLYDQAQL